MIARNLHRLLYFILLFALIVVSSLNISNSQEISSPISTQFEIFQKVLSFNRAKTTNSGTLILGVIYQSKFRPSLNVANDIERYFREKEVKVSGVSIQIQLIDLINIDLETAINQYGLSFAYIAPLKVYDISTIHKLLAPRKILTLTGIPSYCESNDVSVAIGTDAGKPQIILNRKSYIEEGADFSAQLLKLKFTRIIE
ncbi:MAG: DUF4154 domain-containing protein [Ignavibacteriae bacterium]|nr:DUF4154 domain-containing protein [Ignavibacteriota bacterium]